MWESSLNIIKLMAESARLFAESIQLFLFTEVPLLEISVFEIVFGGGVFAFLVFCCAKFFVDIAT